MKVLGKRSATPGDLLVLGKRSAAPAGLLVLGTTPPTSASTFYYAFDGVVIGSHQSSLEVGPNIDTLHANWTGEGGVFWLDAYKADGALVWDGDPSVFTMRSGGWPWTYTTPCALTSDAAIYSPHGTNSSSLRWASSYPTGSFYFEDWHAPRTRVDIDFYDDGTPGVQSMQILAYNNDPNVAGFFTLQQDNPNMPYQLFYRDDSGTQRTVSCGDRSVGWHTCSIYQTA